MVDGIKNKLTILDIVPHECRILVPEWGELLHPVPPPELCQVPVDQRIVITVVREVTNLVPNGVEGDKDDEDVE